MDFTPRLQASQHAGSLRSPASQHAPAISLRLSARRAGLQPGALSARFGLRPRFQLVSKRSVQAEMLTSHPQGGVLTSEGLLKGPKRADKRSPKGVAS